MNMQQAIAAVTEHQHLTQAQMTAVMNLIMTGEATQAQVGGFLIGLRMKGETVDEITGAVSAMRALASGVKVSGDHVIDTCGTGGDSSGIFNVSTALLSAMVRSFSSFNAIARSSFVCRTSARRESLSRRVASYRSISRSIDVKIAS